LGFGRSDLPDEGDLTIAGHGGRLIEMLDALRIDRACLVGHGLGGAIAQWTAAYAPARVSGLALIESATTGGWFSNRHSLAASIPAAALGLPRWCWMPFARMAIARRYDDWARGYRSAEMFLLPFSTPAGSAVLRKHLRALSSDQPAESRRDTVAKGVPTLDLTSDGHRYSPEEYPSEIAAAVAKLLAT